MNFEIIPAIEATMAEVEAWLDAEEAAYQVGRAAWADDGFEGDGPTRGFRCNWDSTKRVWREGGGGIDILVVDGKAIGFQGLSLFEIRSEFRRKGYGRILAEHMVAAAFEEGLSIIEIGIAPPTAEPFWREMGFSILPERQGPGGGIFAYLVLERRFDLGDGARVPYRVSFYTADERYSSNGKPFRVFSGLGESLPDGTVQLPERAYCFDPADDWAMDQFVRIEIAGKELHLGKVKYGCEFGVQRDAGYNYFVDRVLLGSSSKG